MNFKNHNCFLRELVVSQMLHVIVVINEIQWSYSQSCYQESKVISSLPVENLRFCCNLYLSVALGIC